MFRIDTATAISGSPSYGAAGPVSGGRFTAGVPGVVDGTIPGEDFFNQTMMELCNAVTDDGAALNKASDRQLADRLTPLKALKSHATSTGAVSTTHRRAVLAAYDCAASGAQSLAAASSGATVSGVYSFAAATFSACAATGTCSGVLAAQASTASGTRSLAAAANNCTVPGENAAALASDGCDVAGTNSGVMASVGCTTTATWAQQAAVASEDCTLEGNNAAAVAADSCEVKTARTAAIAAELCVVDNLTSAAVASSGSSIQGTGTHGLIGASSDCYVTGTRSVLLGSYRAQLADDNCVAFGYSGGGPITPGGSNQNLTLRIDVDTGEVHADGSYFNTGADYAELAENAEPGVLAPGRLVTESPAGGVMLARLGDPIVGVVSRTAGVIGNAAALEWSGRYERDEWGAPLLAPRRCVRWAAEKRVTTAPGRRGYVGPIAECPTDLEVRPEHRRWSVDVTHYELVEVADPAGDPKAAQLLEALVSKLSPRVAAPIRAAAAAAQRRFAAAVRYRMEPVTRQVEYVEIPAVAGARTVEIVRDAYDGPEEHAPTPIPADAEYFERELRVETAGYDASRAYVARSQRPEDYTVVGMMGQVYVAFDDSPGVGPRTWLGTGTTPGLAAPAPSGRLLVKRVAAPYDPAKGYGVAYCWLL